MDSRAVSNHSHTHSPLQQHRAALKASFVACQTSQRELTEHSLWWIVFHLESNTVSQVRMGTLRIEFSMALSPKGPNGSLTSWGYLLESGTHHWN